MRPALAGERAQTDGRLLARELECQSCLAGDETIAGGVCLGRTGGGKKGTVSTVLQVKYKEEATKRCEGLKPALVRERVQTDGRLLARGLECQSCLARDETIAGGVCLDRTGGGGKKGTVSTVLQVKYIEEPTKRCEGLKPALARERAQTDGRLLARGLECQSCMARDETIAGGVCLDRTGVGGGEERYRKHCPTSKVHRRTYKEMRRFETGVGQGKCSANA